jgi:hypothetical protein
MNKGMINNMATVIVPVQVPQGISIAEQNCYLAHQGDNQAIMACLNDIAASNGTIGLVMLVILCVLVLWMFLA